MKPANFLHLFIIILLLSFTISEHSTYQQNIEQHHYDLRVRVSHLQRYGGKSEETKAEIAAIQQELKDTKNFHQDNFSMTSYKVLVVLGLFLIALFQFIAYFRIDFSDEADIVPANNYQRKTWLLSFFMLLVTAVWIWYFRGSPEWAFVTYIASVFALVRSLMLATELRLITKKRGTPLYKGVTLLTTFVVYFNFLGMALIYVTVYIEQSQAITAAFVQWIREVFQ
jgi:cytochrome bd-type quinol oxidase subunit 2